MRKFYYPLIIILLIAAGAFYFISNRSVTTILNNPSPGTSTPAGENILPGNSGGENSLGTTTEAIAPGFSAPLERAGERVTKKPFGIYITPKTSPVEPERFQGYHTGADFEVFPEELDKDIPVRAVCSGNVLTARTVSGYGGVLVQSCKLGQDEITVLYGHLDIASVSLKMGDAVKAGDEIGILGKDKSAQTDGERKHLHLSFHKGSAVELRGYVRDKNELAKWIDPCLYVCRL